MKKFLMGNEILVLAAKDAGAKIMFGYPITPTTEVLANWIKLCQETNFQYKYLQTEDENSSGFGVCGAVMAGVPAFTATAGPGNILMQDAIVMAEAMRLPFVGYIGMRGAPSSGTVIYSQQEVNLTIFGGNGEGLRIVYSSASLQDLYNYGKKVFETAWKYRFPTFLLYDGYQAKMKGEVDIPDSGEKILKPKHEPILKGNMRNIYSLEEELGEAILKYKEDFERVAEEIIEYETLGNQNAEILVIAHGIVASAAKLAVLKLNEAGKKVSFFRPITLWPFPLKQLSAFLGRAKKILVFESSLGQFSRLLKDQIYWFNIPLIEINKPGVGFTAEEIKETIINFF